MNSTYWTDPQPSPRTGTGGALWPLAIHRFVGHVSPEVLADMGQRHAFGIAKYGVGLQANNGRDARVDLYQELLDAVVYCEQLIQEAKPPDVPCPLQVRLQRRLVEILCIVRQLPAGETSTAGEASTAGETSAEGDTSTAAETSSGSAATSAPASATSTAAAGCSAGLLQATIATYNPEETRNFFMSETKAVEPASPAVCHNSGTRFHTASGVSFNLSNPKAEDIRLTDIAHALSRIPRFGGHLDKHYSVANHSLVVLRVFREARPQATAREQLTALLHDAAEAYVGDVITPLKTAMAQRGGSYDAIEARVDDCIVRRFFLSQDEDVLKAIKETDFQVFLAECRQLRGWDDETFRLYNLPCGSSTSPGVHWDDWISAQDLFLQTALKLLREMA